MFRILKIQTEVGGRMENYNFSYEGLVDLLHFKLHYEMKLFSNRYHLFVYEGHIRNTIEKIEIWNKPDKRGNFNIIVR